MVIWSSFEQDGNGDGIYALQFAAQYFGISEDEEITGTAVDNWIYGRDGDDVLNGLQGNDTLDGGAGDDTLLGGKGADVLFFEAGNGSNKIFDFKNGKGKLDLSAFDFANKAEAKSHFFEKGSAINDVVGFKFDGTTIRIEGLDLGDINGADIII